jgi:hypothetical protein
MRVVVHLPWLTLLAVACSVSGPDRGADPLARLDLARRQWQSSGVSEYELAMRRSCGECPPAAASAVVVSVSAGGIAVSLAGNGEPVDPPFAELYPDVDGLFELIENALVGGVADVQVDYDRDRGYPRSVSIDALPDAVDDELGYVVDDLVIGRHAELRAELRAQRERWAAQRIEDYQLTLSRSCFCAPEGAGLVVLTVLDGEPVEWLYFLSGDPLEPEWQAVFPTVDGLFDFVEDAIDRGAETIEVTYDAELGLPTHVRVDYRQALADEEIAYEVEKILRIDSGEPPTPDRAVES